MAKLERARNVPFSCGSVIGFFPEAAAKETWMLLLGSPPAWRSGMSREEPPLQGFFCSLLILTCSSLPGERENPRGSPAHASHFPGRWEHLHHRLQPHERAAAGPVEPGTIPNCIPVLLTPSLTLTLNPALQPWNHGMGWVGWDIKAHLVPPP